MTLPKQFFFYATIFVTLTLGSLFIWNPFICESDLDQFATVAFAEEAKSSKILFASCIAILSASLAPLADALFDLLRCCSGLSIPDRSPYTLKTDGTASAVYLAERLSVLLVYDVMAILALVVTSTEGYNYDPVVIYNVVYGGQMTTFLLSGGLFLSILHCSAGSVVTDMVASCVFVLRVASSILFGWGCSPVAWNCAVAVELATTLYVLGLVCRDYFNDKDENEEKSYLKAVSLTYATVYWVNILAAVITAASTLTFVRYPITRFFDALYICVTSSYLASPKWREELFQSVRLRKSMNDLAASRRFRLAQELRKATKATIAAMATPTTMASTPEGADGEEDEKSEEKLKPKQSPFLQRSFFSSLNSVAAE